MQAKIPHSFQFQDSGRAEFFQFDLGPHANSLYSSGLASALRGLTYLFVVGGSGCVSMQAYLPDYFRGLGDEAGPVRVFILQKRFIRSQSSSVEQACSEEFIRNDYPGRWLADQTEFIAAELARASTNYEKPARLVLLGISEGAEVVPLLAHRFTATTHLVLLSNGGMDPLDAYRLLVQRSQGSSMADDFDRVIQALKIKPVDPDAVPARINGRSWRYWDELQHLQQERNLLSLKIPILVGVGDADDAVPIASAHELQEQFDRAGKTNLSLHIYPGADHGLRSRQHFYLPDFMHQFDAWLEGNAFNDE